MTHPHPDSCHVCPRVLASSLPRRHQPLCAGGGLDPAVYGNFDIILDPLPNITARSSRIHPRHPYRTLATHVAAPPAISVSRALPSSIPPYHPPYNPTVPPTRAVSHAPLLFLISLNYVPMLTGRCLQSNHVPNLIPLALFYLALFLQASRTRPRSPRSTRSWTLSTQSAPTSTSFPTIFVHFPVALCAPLRAYAYRPLTDAYNPMVCPILQVQHPAPHQLGHGGK